VAKKGARGGEGKRRHQGGGVLKEDHPNCEGGTKGVSQQENTLRPFKNAKMWGERMGGVLSKGGLALKGTRSILKDMPARLGGGGSPFCWGEGLGFQLCQDPWR